MNEYLLLAIGLALLISGGEMLVRGASTAAQSLGMSPLLIGLTLVGFGTSMPELVTSVEASLLGAPGIAVGNIVGSNIANILLILGLTAIIAPVAVARNALHRDGVIVIAAAALFVAIGYFGSLNRLASVFLVLGLASYLVYAYRQEKMEAGGDHTAALEKAEAHDELFGHQSPSNPSSRYFGILFPLGLALAGLATIILGGKTLVDGATEIARSAGISETVIGLTIVSVGTSLPEMVTSVIAAIRRHTDVALGNILGSNIYNILGIGGATGLLAPTVIPTEIARFDGPFMLAVSLVLFAFAYTGRRIGRLEGGALLAGYGTYVYLIWP